MGALLIGLERVAYIINRSKIYELLYLQRISEQAHLNLESALAALYAHILKFLATANKLYSKNIGSRIAHGILNPDEVVNFVEKCTPLEDRVDIEANICENTYNRGVNTEFTNHAKEFKRLLVDLKEPIMRVDYRVAAMFVKLNESEQSDILRALSSIPYEDSHKTARQGRTNGTGRWLLNHERYREWRGSSASMILWLHGFRRCFILSKRVLSADKLH